jgi:hypothetical protein
VHFIICNKARPMAKKVIAYEQFMLSLWISLFAHFPVAWWRGATDNHKHPLRRGAAYEFHSRPRLHRRNESLEGRLAQGQKEEQQGNRRSPVVPGCIWTGSASATISALEPISSASHRGLPRLARGPPRYLNAQTPHPLFISSRYYLFELETSHATCYL